MKRTRLSGTGKREHPFGRVGAGRLGWLMALSALLLFVGVAHRSAAQQGRPTPGRPATGRPATGRPEPTAQPPRKNDDPVIAPRFPRRLNIAGMDIKPALRMVCRESLPAHELEIAVPRLTGTVSLQMDQPFLEDAVVELLKQADQKVGYQVDIRARKFTIVPDPRQPFKPYYVPASRASESAEDGADPSLIPNIVVPVGHSGGISTVAVSPQGNRVATAGTEGNVVVWENGNPLRTMSGTLSRSPFSPDGNRIYTAMEQFVYEWNLVTGEQTRKEFKARVVSVSVASETGTLFVSREDGKLEVRPRLREAGRVLTVTGWRCEFVASPSGRYAVGIPRRSAAGSTGPQHLRLWVEGTNFVGETRIGKDISDAAIHPQEKWIAVGTNDARVVLCGLPGGTPEYAGLCTRTAASTNLAPGNLEGAGAAYRWTPTAVAFSPDGKRLAAASEGGRIHQWRLGPDGAGSIAGTALPAFEAFRLRYSNLGASSLAYSEDSQRLIAGSPDQLQVANVALVEERSKLRIFDADSGKLAGLLTAPSEVVQQIFPAPVANRLYAVGATSVRVWDTTLVRRPTPLRAGYPAAMSPDRFWFAARSTEAPEPSDIPPVDAFGPPALRTAEENRKGSSPKARDAARQQEDALARLRQRPVHGVALYETEGLLKVPFRKLKPYAGEQGECQSLAFDPTGLRVAASGWSSHAVYLFRTSDGAREPLLWGGHNRAINRLVFSGSGRFLVSRADGAASGTSELAVWGTQADEQGLLLWTPGRSMPRTLRPPRRIPLEEQGLFRDEQGTVRNAPGTPVLAVAPLPDTRLWDGFPERGAADFAVSPNREGSQLLAVASGYPEYQVRVYDLETGFPVMPPVPGEQPRFSPDGSLLFVHRRENFSRTAEAWDLTTHQVVLRFPETGELLAGQSWANGRINLIFRGATAHHFKVWQWPVRQGGRWDWSSNAITGHHGKIESAAYVFDQKVGRLWSGAQDGTVRCFRLGREKETTADGKTRTVSPGEVAAFVAVGDGDFLATVPENYYFATKGALKRIFFRVAGRNYPFDQFDLRLNRPDLLLARLRAPADAIARKQAHVAVRMQALGLTEEQLQKPLPEILREQPVVRLASEPERIQKTRTLSLHVHGTDPGRPLTRFRLFVNEVRVSLPELAITDGGTRDGKGYHAAAPLSIPLLRGRNKVEISVENAEGLESLRLVREIQCDVPQPDPVLYVVAIGVSRYRDSYFDLKFAAKDAQEIAALFTRFKPEVRAPKPPPAKRAPTAKPPAKKSGSRVSASARKPGTPVRRPPYPGRVPLPAPPAPAPTVLLNRPAYGTRYSDVKVLFLPDDKATQRTIRERVPAFLRQASPQDQVIFFMAGHGVRHPQTLEYHFLTHDFDPAQIDATTLRLGEVDDFLLQCPARQKLILLDTCNSGAVVPVRDGFPAAALTSPSNSPATTVTSEPVSSGEEPNNPPPTLKNRGLVFGKLGSSSDADASIEDVNPGEDWAQVLQDSFAVLDRGSGADLIAACSGSKVAFEDYVIDGKTIPNGVLTFYLKKAFNPAPDKPTRRNADTREDGWITVSELHRYVTREVQRATRGKQVPTLPRENLEFDFPIIAGRPTPPGR
ncbi:MAG: hypothetical protein OHK0029_41250 [Armatimonadaceae bacterium]